MVIREIRHYTHTETFVKLYLFREIYIIFAKSRGNLRNLSLQTHTNIREALSFSQNLFYFRENSWSFEKFVFTHTQKRSWSFVFFEKFVLFSRKFVVIREIRIYTHNKHSRSLIFFANFFFIFAKICGNSRNSFLHTNRNILEAISFSRNLYYFHENSW